MIKTIRISLEYNTYCLWLYNEKDEIIDNNNPPEWDNDETLTQLFMSVSDLYDTFFIDTEKEFSYIGCPDEDTKIRLAKLLSEAVSYLEQKNNGKYIIENKVHLDVLLN